MAFPSLDEFTAGVQRLAELREQHLLRVRVSAPGAVTFAIDKRAEDVPPQGSGLYADIFEVLESIGTGASAEEFVRTRDGTRVETEEADVSRAKYEAVARVFPRKQLKAPLRRRSRASLARMLVRMGKRSGRLARLMRSYRFRALLGPEGRRAGWSALGAQIAQNVFIGPRVWMQVPSRVRIGAGSKLSGEMKIESYGEISIGRNVLINDTDLFSTQHDIDHPRFKGERRFISIGDYAWLPHKIIVLPGVRIGSHAVIGTGSVVSRDVPDYGVAVGNPARVVKERARIHYTYVPSSVHRAPLIE